MPVCKVKIGNTLHDITYDNDKELFHAIARLNDIFGHTNCGKCDSENIKYQVRKAHSKAKNKDFFYYELVCNDCSCKFSFGSLEDAKNLYPKTRAKDGKPKPNKGWEMYVKDDEE